MAHKEEFEITIGPNGEIQIEVKGAKGKSCVELTAFLEQALGEVKSKDFKPEYHQQEDKGTTKIRKKT
jgi:hypothetical protein